MLKPAQARMARAALKWSLLDLQEKTGINKNTIVRFEAGKGILLSTAIKLEEAFAKEGATFVYEDGTRGLGVLLSTKLSRRLDETAGTRAKGKSTKRGTKRK
jgi:transcriptional regulator with XRE-family HTH domain